MSKISCHLEKFSNNKDDFIIDNYVYRFFMNEIYFVFNGSSNSRQHNRVAWLCMPIDERNSKTF